MMNYYHHPYASNSDLKKLVARVEGRFEEPANLQKIYNFGTEFHAGILEPHKMNTENLTPEQVKQLKAMHRTFWGDDLCKALVMQSDFRREWEFYRLDRFGINARAKLDGESAKTGTILELKGLAVSSQKAFEESIEYHNYDQGAAWYINVATGHRFYNQKLVVGISKEYEDRLFKILINRDHKLYKHGLVKVKKAVTLWKQFGFN